MAEIGANASFSIHNSMETETINISKSDLPGAKRFKYLGSMLSNNCGNNMKLPHTEAHLASGEVFHNLLLKFLSFSDFLTKTQPNKTTQLNNSRMALFAIDASTNA